MKSQYVELKNAARKKSHSEIGCVNEPLYSWGQGESPPRKIQKHFLFLRGQTRVKGILARRHDIRQNDTQHNDTQHK
jgi:hypothetical protein